jgi:hypothetical protein
MIPTRLLLTSVLWICIAASTSYAATCSGDIISSMSLPGKTPYDPYSAIPVTDNYDITVLNTGSGPCVFALSIGASAAPENRLGNTLIYTLTNPSGRSILIDPAGTPPRAQFFSPAVPPKSTYTFQFQLRLERGQFALPGSYSDVLNITLCSTEGAQIKMPCINKRPMTLTYTVPQSLSINLKGGAHSMTMSFEPFASGTQRSVLIEARGNLPHRLNITSAKQGVMALTPPVPGHDWSVSYTAALAGRPLDLHQVITISDLPATHPRSDAVYNLMVTTGSVSGKRAGRYEDTITVEIVGAM